MGVRPLSRVELMLWVRGMTNSVVAAARSSLYQSGLGCATHTKFSF